MKTYPHIEYQNKGIWGEKIYAFDKLDGSNIRAEWSRKRGFYKFGTKNVMIDEGNEQFGKAVSLFLNKYSDSLSKVFTDKKEYRNTESFVVFCEYLGSNSQFGNHDPNDEMDIILFDVNEYKRGFIPPKEFVENFGHLPIPKIIYTGNYNKSLIQDIKDNIYNLHEGVIVKGTYSTKRKNQELVWMVKIKTNDWLSKLKQQYGEKVLLKELNGDKTLL